MNGLTIKHLVFVLNLFQEPPNRLHIFWFIGDIWVFHIYPIPHFLRQVIPYIGITHHGSFTRFVILFYRDFYSDVFFGDSEFFFGSKLYRMSVGIPPCFTFYLKAFLSFISTENILNRTSQQVMTTQKYV